MTMAAPFNFSLHGDPPADLMEVSTDANRDIHASDDIDIDIDFEGGGLVGNEDEHMGEIEGEGEGDGNVSLRDDAEMADETPMPEDEIIEDAVQLDSEHRPTYFTGDQELHDLEDLEGQHGFQGSDSNIFFDDPKDIQAETQNQVFTTAESQAHAGGHGPETNNNIVDEQIQNHKEEQNPYDVVEDSVTAVAATGREFPASEQAITENHAYNIADSLKETSESVTVQGIEQADGHESAELEAMEEPEAPSYQINDEEHDIEDGADNEDEFSAHLGAQADSKPEPDTEGAEHRISTPEANNEESQSSAGYSENDPATTVEETDAIYPTAVVTYKENEMALFPPLHDNEEAQTYLLTDESLAKGPLRTMLRSCRMVLGEDLPETEELELVIPSLGLSYLESHPSSSEVVLTDLIDLYTQLQRNDGVDEPEPIKILLQTRIRMSKRLESLYDARNNGQGLSNVSIDFHNNFYITGLPDDSFDFTDGKDFMVQPDVTPGDSKNLPENNEQEHHHAGSTPEAPKEDWLANDLGVDDFDFRSPHRTQKGTREAALGDVGQDLENNTVTLGESAFEITESYDDFDVNQPENEEASFTLFDDTKDPSFEARNGHDIGLEANTYSDEENKDSHELEDALPVEETHERADFTEPPLPLETEDDLDEFGDIETSQAVEHSDEVSSSTIVDSKTNTSLMQNEREGKDRIGEVVADDEITYEDEDEIEDHPTNQTDTESNSKPMLPDSPTSSLKRQRPVIEGDDDSFDSSQQPQPNQKRIRGDNEA